MKPKQTTNTTDDLLTAARNLLARIDEITTEEFSKGGERVEREALRAVLAKMGAEPTR